MSMLTSIASYVMASALLTVVPGPDNAVLLRNAIRGGRSTGVATAAGCAVGLLCWGLVAALGLTALVTASQIGYDALRVAGACYLVLLGVTTWRRAGTQAATAHPGSTPATAGFRTGLTTDLLNPKAAVFFVSFLPQFIPPGSDVFAMTVLYGAIQAVLMIAWGLAIVALVQRAQTILASTAVRRRLERTTATLMIGFGLRLAIDL